MCVLCSYYNINIYARAYYILNVPIVVYRIMYIREYIILKTIPSGSRFYTSRPFGEPKHFQQMGNTKKKELIKIVCYIRSIIQSSPRSKSEQQRGNNWTVKNIFLQYTGFRTPYNNRYLIFFFLLNNNV